MAKKHDVTVDIHFIEAVEQACVVMKNAATYIDGKHDKVTQEVLSRFARVLEDQVNGIRVGLEYHGFSCD